jgi:hypothetical protein
MSEETKKYLALIGGILIGFIFGVTLAHAHDDGRFAASPLKPWFDGLKSNKGMCCSFADGVTVKGVDWDTINVASAGKEPDVRYRVRLDGQWIVVPPDAVVTEPNRYGDAVVWPYQDAAGATQIRCFIPGSGA